MRRLVAVMVLTVAFNAIGCAHQVQLKVNKDSELFGIRALKNVPETHPAAVLFVNRSAGIWQRCLVFEDYLSKDQLLDPDYSTGGFKLMHEPIGYFEVGPAIDGHPVTEKTKLVGFFFPRTDYTVLCFLEGFDGLMVDVQTMNIRFDPRVPGERFYYTTMLGTPAERFVNHYQFLPQWYSYYGRNTFGLTININDLLRRFIHSVSGRNNGPKIEEDENNAEEPKKSDSPYLNPKFPKLPAKPDSTK